MKDVVVFECVANTQDGSQNKFSYIIY